MFTTNTYLFKFRDQKNAVNILDREHIRSCVLFLGYLLLRKITEKFKYEIRLEMRISLYNR